MIGFATRRAVLAPGRAAAVAEFARPRAGACVAAALASRGAARLSALSAPLAVAGQRLCRWEGRRAFSDGGVLQIKTPEFGAESITEGTMQEWNKKAGDFVEAGEVIATIETDKVSVEVKATQSGTILEVLVAVDETVQVGQPLATMQPGGTALPKKAA
eukprot:CAMPEP_0183514690 /NCGR_PEP_ID=MMETSP0371-20130417/13044_1 /TAXON_ID=268820 /ORGANISM="Peridinium aciculiferum, Strain PAER-2" /LENGTH=158 /DNA_ID=CAMNT_0025712131 /DNA_START=66 /DNA_END=538 /DNA_ORIENTATION=-